MKKNRKQSQRKSGGEPVVASPPRPHTINFFCRFDPGQMAKTNFENEVLVFQFFNGPDKPLPWPLSIMTKPFSLFFPELEITSTLAFAGDSDAAELLVEIATQLTFRITALENAQPGIMSQIARTRPVWPVVLSPQSGANNKELARLNQLGVGQSVGHIDVRFRKATGSDEDRPARRWAKDAVRCINSTRLNQQQLAANEKIVAEKFKTGTWKRGLEPAWVAKTRDLPDFSPPVLKQWGAVIREMIREQIPDFETRPEWEPQRNTCRRNQEMTKGEIQNAVLDDIVAALKTVAPEVPI